MMNATDSCNVQRRIINPWTWQDAWGYVQANEITSPRRALICSGQLATDADGHLLHAGDMRGQIGQSLDNLETVLQANGLGLSDVVRLNYYTTDVDSFVEATPILANAWARPTVGPRATCSASHAWSTPIRSWSLKNRRYVARTPKERLDEREYAVGIGGLGQGID